MTNTEVDGDMNDEQGDFSHLTTEQLLDYLEQKLAPEDIKKVEEHLATDCAKCHSDLIWYKNTINMMSSDVLVQPPLQLRQTVQRFFREHHQTSTVPAEGRSTSLGEWLKSFFEQPRSVAIGFAAAIALVIVSALIFQYWFNQPGLEQASVAMVEGTVVAYSVENEDWQPVTTASSFEEGDLIRTGDDSTVVLAYPDESHTTVSPNSEVAILQLSSSEDGTHQEIVLRQDLGSTHNVVQPQSSPESRFEIQTPSAVISVRGTEFTVDVDSIGTTDVFVLEGLVDVSAQGETIMLSAGEGATVEPGSPPGSAEPSPTVTKPPNKATPLSSRNGSDSEQPDETIEAEDTETPTPVTPTNTPLPAEETETPTPTKASATPEATATSRATASPTPVTPEPTTQPTEPPPPPDPTQPPPEPTEPPPPPPPTEESQPPSPTEPPPPPPTEPPPPPPPTSEPYPAPKSGPPPTEPPPPPPPTAPPYPAP